MTAEDFKLHLLRAHQGRPQGSTPPIPGARCSDIEVAVADQGGDELQFAGADRAAVARLPRQLHGAEGLYREGRRRRRSAQKPIGTGPYKLVEYQLNSRIVLERNDSYWGPKPKIRRVTFEIIKDPSARVAAIQSGQVDLTINVPVREVERLQARAELAAELNPITRVILLQVRNDLGFADENVRLAAHHAIDKEALSKAFYGGAAVPLSRARRRPARPGYLAGFQVRLRSRDWRSSCWRNPASARTSRRRSVRHHQRPLPERLRHRARDRSRCGRRSASRPSSR